MSETLSMMASETSVAPSWSISVTCAVSRCAQRSSSATACSIWTMSFSGIGDLHVDGALAPVVVVLGVILPVFLIVALRFPLGLVARHHVAVEGEEIGVGEPHLKAVG